MYIYVIICTHVCHRVQTPIRLKVLVFLACLFIIGFRGSLEDQYVYTEGTDHKNSRRMLEGIYEGSFQ